MRVFCKLCQPQQNIFNTFMCLLFAIVLALLQFRVIRDSHLPFLCYGILFFTAAFCFISMPTVGNVFPVDTKEVSAVLVFRIWIIARVHRRDLHTRHSLSVFQGVMQQALTWAPCPWKFWKKTHLWRLSSSTSLKLRSTFPQRPLPTETKLTTVPKNRWCVLCTTQQQLKLRMEFPFWYASKFCPSAVVRGYAVFAVVAGVVDVLLMFVDVFFKALWLRKNALRVQPFCGDERRLKRKDDAVC